MDAYHLRVMVERMQQEGRSEWEIVAAVEESDDGSGTPAREAPRRWPARLIRSGRSR
jgi:hypothetical protein